MQSVYCKEKCVAGVRSEEVWRVDCGVGSVECRVWKLQSVECEV